MVLFCSPNWLFFFYDFLLFYPNWEGGAGPTGPSSRSVTAGCLLRVAVP